MVFCGLFPIDNDDYADFRDALEKLSLNDAALAWEPETSDALGFGFRCGFLGLLHMDIVRERLEREYDLELMATMPSVGFEVTLTNGDDRRGPQPVRHAGSRRGSRRSASPTSRPRSCCPKEYVGVVMELCQERRGEHAGMHYLSADRVQLHYDLPLSRDRPGLLRPAEVAHARLRVAGLRGARAAAVEPRQARRAARAATRSTRCRWSSTRTRPTRSAATSPRSCARRSRASSSTCRSRPRSARAIVARETVKAFRKDVTAKCYGGDISRKRKLLERQKEGKKRMKQVGRIEVPQEAFLAVLELGDERPAKSDGAASAER